jgi:hypothetical protein
MSLVPTSKIGLAAISLDLKARLQPWQYATAIRSLSVFNFAHDLA